MLRAMKEEVSGEKRWGAVGTQGVRSSPVEVAHQECVFFIIIIWQMLTVPTSHLLGPQATPKEPQTFCNSAYRAIPTPAHSRRAWAGSPPTLTHMLAGLLETVSLPNGVCLLTAPLSTGASWQGQGTWQTIPIMAGKYGKILTAFWIIFKLCSFLLLQIDSNTSD